MPDVIDQSPAHEAPASEPDKAPPEIDLLRRHLADRDEPCPSCGYNLRGLASAKCPECHLALRLGVQLHEPRTALIIGGIIGLMCGAAPFAALLVFTVSMTLRTQSGPPAGQAWFWYGLPALYSFVLGGLTWWLASRPGRCWFRKLSPSTARWTSVSGLALSVLCHAAFVVLAVKYIR
jgi:hypothetical protein